MNITRRGFVGSAALAGAPFFIGCGAARAAVPRQPGPNGRINVGIIGCGVIAKGTNVPGFLKDPRCRVTVACDMVKEAPGYFYGTKKSNFGAEGLAVKDTSSRKDVCGSRVIKAAVDKHYGDTSCREVFDWREVVADPSIDAEIGRAHV